MTRSAIAVMLILLAPAVGCAAPAGAEPPRRYTIDELEVVIMISPDGTVRVLEKIVFNFTSGNFTMAYRRIPHYGFEELREVSVHNESGDMLKSGSTYSFDWFRGVYEVRWTFDPILGPANATFLVAYVYRGAVTQVSKDQDAIDWYAVGPEWEVPIGHVNVTVMLPADYSNSTLLRTSPRNMDRLFTPMGTFLFLNRSELPARTPVRVVVHFPKSVELSVSWERYLRENWFLVAMLFFGITLLVFALNSVIRVVASRFPPGSPRPDKRLHANPAKLATLLDGRYTPGAFLSGLVAMGRAGTVRMAHDPASDDLLLETREPEDVPGGHDATVLAALAEERSARGLAAQWPGLRAQLQRLCRMELKYDGMIRFSGRLPVAPVLGGLIPLILGLSLLGVLVYADQWDAVLWGGVLLGLSLMGATILVVGGVLTPNRSFRGAREVAVQRAFLAGIATRLEETAASKPAEFAAPFIQFLPLLVAANAGKRGRLPELLRRISSAGPGAPLDVHWYDFLDRSAGEPGTAGWFGRTFSATSQQLPAMLATLPEAAAAEPVESGLYQDGPEGAAPPGTTGQEPPERRNRG